MHEDEVEISPFKTRVKLLRCAECGEPLASELVRQALCRGGGPVLQEVLARGDLCPRCKRARLATKLSIALPANRSS
jgi:hypothetical protein